MLLTGNSRRPFLLAWKTLMTLLQLKLISQVSVGGWKYFFASLNIIRLGKGRLSLSPGSWFENGVLLHCIDGHLSIGEKTFVNKGSVIACMDSITIGNDVLIADHVSIYDHDHGLVNRSEYTTKPVVIADKVWLGSHSVVLKGVCIGKGSIVAAGSVVTKNIPSYEIWGGIPAKFIRKIEI